MYLFIILVVVAREAVQTAERSGGGVDECGARALQLGRLVSAA